MDRFLQWVLCNALVCLAIWPCYSARTVTDKILAILFPIIAFVALGFEHCVANMYFIPMGTALKHSETFMAIAAKQEVLMNYPAASSQGIKTIFILYSLYAASGGELDPKQIKRKNLIHDKSKKGKGKKESKLPDLVRLLVTLGCYTYYPSTNYRSLYFNDHSGL